ncbi:gliding motility protein RemB [Wenyingzhuangia sp. IMCC45533]
MKRILSILLLSINLVHAQRNKDLFPEHQSQLRIPFNHASYSVFEKGIYNADDIHTSVKPYVYNVVSESANLTQIKSSLLKNKSTWGGRKLWNEHLLEVRGKDYWLNLDFLLDGNVGRENGDAGTTIENTRILKLEGQLGNKISFSFTGTETQAKFPQFIREYILINQPEDAGGLIPGRGKAKSFGETGFDYGISTGYVSYTPNKFFNIQFGHGQNFIGDGYRSLLLSDVAAPRTYAKLTTKIGKLEYTNIWTWLRDFNFTIDTDENVDFENNATHKRKYGIFHHLSWNVNRRLNLGFFEGIISDNSGTSGSLQAEYFNPVIFYKNVEFANGEDGGSGAVGLDIKYRVWKQNYLYAQFLLDEFSADKFFKSNGYWANKYAFQLGVKSFDLFNVKGLLLQAEFNKAKPFTYSHEEQHNYAHFGQPLAHLWGANFWEAIFIARYNRNRWGINTKFSFGKKGFDFFGDDISNGGNIFINSGKRASDFGNEDQQGNLASITNIDLEVSYLINPSNNFKIYAGAYLRNFDAEADITRVGIVPRLKQESLNTTFNTENTQWFVMGVKADLFNFYKDY